MDLSLATLRTIRAVAERRSFSAAAEDLGYTQSAISRQIAAAERELGVRLFDRSHAGVRLTPEGTAVLRHVVVALDALGQAERDLVRAAPNTRAVRIGAFTAAGAVLLPRAVTLLRRRHPDIEVSTREGTTPALVRSIRAGTLDFAVISARPPYRTPDQDTPALAQHTLLECELSLAVAATGRFAGLLRVPAESAASEPWISTPSSDDEPQLGVWPGLPGRPRVRHTARDWTTKLALVAAGAGVTTVLEDLLPDLPDGVQVARLDGVPAEERRISLAYSRDVDRATARDVVEAFTLVGRELSAQRESRAR